MVPAVMREVQPVGAVMWEVVGVAEALVGSVMLVELTDGDFVHHLGVV